MLGLRQLGHRSIDLFLGDIAQFVCDACVTAANPQLAGGGGVDGAVHRVAGPGLIDECRTRYPDGCPTGGAVVTGAGDLPARWVIHAVGPVWQGGGHDEARLLTSTYRSIIQRAAELEARHVAIPSLSTGAYGYPVREAAPIAVRALVDALLTLSEDRPKRVTLVLWSAGDYAICQEALFAAIPEGDGTGGAVSERSST